MLLLNNLWVFFHYGSFANYLLIIYFFIDITIKGILNIYMIQILPTFKPNLTCMKIATEWLSFYIVKN